MNYHRLTVAGRATATVVCIALAGVGCGSAPIHRGSPAAAGAGKRAPRALLSRLTPATLETQISGLQQRVGISVEAVHCPRDVPILNGHTLTCVTTQTNGAPVRTRVTPTNAGLGLAGYQFPLRAGTP
jgi:hypothetical protein